MADEIIARLDAIDKKLFRLELIESHLLDVLIPNRKHFMQVGQQAPPPVLTPYIQSGESIFVETSEPAVITEVNPVKVPKKKGK